jgi:hypothetical protein
MNRLAALFDLGVLVVSLFLSGKIGHISPGKITLAWLIALRIKTSNYLLFALPNCSL